MRYTILALLLVACGSKTLSNNFDPTFVPYVNSFESDSLAVRGYPYPISGLTIRFAQPGELTGTEDGQCVYFTNTILVDPVWWGNQSDDLLRQTLIYHELGHCVLGRVHRFDMFPFVGSWTPAGGWNTAYVSIMNPYSLVNDACYGENRIAYLKELFGVP